MALGSASVVASGLARLGRPSGLARAREGSLVAMEFEVVSVCKLGKLSGVVLQLELLN